MGPWHPQSATAIILNPVEHSAHGSLRFHRNGCHRDNMSQHKDHTAVLSTSTCRQPEGWCCWCAGTHVEITSRTKGSWKSLNRSQRATRKRAAIPCIGIIERTSHAPCDADRTLRSFWQAQHRRAHTQVRYSSTIAAPKPLTFGSRDRSCIKANQPKNAP